MTASLQGPSAVTTLAVALSKQHYDTTNKNVGTQYVDKDVARSSYVYSGSSTHDVRCTSGMSTAYPKPIPKAIINEVSSSQCNFCRQGIVVLEGRISPN